MFWVGNQTIAKLGPVQTTQNHLSFLSFHFLLIESFNKVVVLLLLF